METVVQYNRIEDITPEDRAFVEFCADAPLEELDIDEVNDFLNGYALFTREEDYWKSITS